MFGSSKLNLSFKEVLKPWFWCTLLLIVLLSIGVLQYAFVNYSAGFINYSFSFYMLLAILLMPFNILCENLKLYYKLHPSMNLFQITRQVCKGFTLNLFFPLGLGQYVGRSLFTKGRQVGDIIKITAISSFTQTSCNLCFGVLLGFPIIKKLIHINQMTIWISIILSIVCIGSLLLMLIWIDQSGINFLLKIKASLKNKWNFSWNEFTGKDWFVLSGLSFFRYSIYFLQAVLILISFPGIDLFSAICSAAVFFMMLSLIYLPGILSLVSRSAIACFVFSYIGLQNGQALFFSWFIFLLNIVLPAMLGIYYMFDDAIQTE